MPPVIISSTWWMCVTFLQGSFGHWYGLDISWGWLGLILLNANSAQCTSACRRMTTKRPCLRHLMGSPLRFTVDYTWIWWAFFNGSFLSCLFPVAYTSPHLGNQKPASSAAEAQGPWTTGHKPWLRWNGLSLIDTGCLVITFRKIPRDRVTVKALLHRTSCRNRQKTT